MGFGFAGSSSFISSWNSNYVELLERVKSVGRKQEDSSNFASKWGQEGEKGAINLSESSFDVQSPSLLGKRGRIHERAHNFGDRTFASQRDFFSG